MSENVLDMLGLSREGFCKECRKIKPLAMVEIETVEQHKRADPDDPWGGFIELREPEGVPYDPEAPHGWLTRRGFCETCAKANYGKKSRH
jgi:hypothetical protein